MSLILAPRSRPAVRAGTHQGDPFFGSLIKGIGSIAGKIFGSDQAAQFGGAIVDRVGASILPPNQGPGGSTFHVNPRARLVAGRIPGQNGGPGSDMLDRFGAPPAPPARPPQPPQQAGVPVAAAARVVGGFLLKFFQGSMQAARAFLRDRRAQAIAGGFIGAGAAQLMIPDDETGACPVGHHLNKSDYFLSDGTPVPKGSVCVKNRRRNPLNPRAADRAIGRLESAKKAVKRLNRVSIRKKKC